MSLLRAEESPLVSGSKTSVSEKGRHVAAELSALCRIDTGILLIFVVLCFVAGLGVPLEERDTPVQPVTVSGQTVFVKDLTFDNKFVESSDQLCPTPLLIAIVILLPAIVLAGGLLLVPIPGDAVAFIHGYLLTMACQEVTKNMMKNYCGYLRPYFYDECDFDDATGRCGDIPDDSRRSFPSGHSSSSFGALLFTSYYLMGKANVSRPLLIPLGSFRVEATNLLLLLSLLPAALATWIASSRVVDNDHHPADIVTGALIGASWASLWYARYYPSIWAENSPAPISASN